MARWWVGCQRRRDDIITALARRRPAPNKSETPVRRPRPPSLPYVCVSPRPRRPPMPILRFFMPRVVPSVFLAALAIGGAVTGYRCGCAAPS